MTSFRSILLGVALAITAFGGFRTYQWTQAIEARLNAQSARLASLEQSADAYKWLSETVVTLPDGRKVSRAQILDLLMSRALQPTKK
jgi:hypothetical protein